MSDPVQGRDSFKGQSDMHSTTTDAKRSIESQHALISASKAEITALNANHKIEMENKHAEYVKMQDDLTAKIQQLQRDKVQQKERIRALTWTLEQVRASAQTTVDSALNRAQSALNEGVTTRLTAIRLEADIVDKDAEIQALKHRISKLQAKVDQRDAGTMMGGK